MRSSFTPGLVVLSLLAAAPPQAHAVEVSAAEFFAACPGPIYLTEDTVVTGKATIEGDCRAGGQFPATHDFELSGVKLKVTGRLELVRETTTLTISGGSSITAEGEIVLDSDGLVRIEDSKLTSKAGQVRVVSDSDIEIVDSTLEAAGDLPVGGGGAFIGVQGSRLSAGGHLQFAPGGYAAGIDSVIVQDSSVFSADRVSFGGGADLVVEYSDVRADGLPTGNVFGGTLNLGPANFASAGNVLTGSSFSAPNGTITVGGSGNYTITDVDMSAGGESGNGYHDAAISFGPQSAIATGLSARTDVGTVHLGGSGSLIFDESSIDAAGISPSTGEGLMIGSSGSITFTNSKLRSRTGSMRIGPSGNVQIEGGKLQADGEDNSGDGIEIGPSGTRTITAVQLKSKVGRITITGNGNAIVSETKMKTGSDLGILLTGGSSFSLLDSNVSAKAGDVRAPNYGSVTLQGNKIKAGGAGGVVAESGFNAGNVTLVTNNQTKSEAVAVRSYQTTTAQDNKFSGADAENIEISASGTCTSTGNDPDVPCM